MYLSESKYFSKTRVSTYRSLVAESILLEA